MDKQILKRYISRQNPMCLDIGCDDGNDTKELIDQFNAFVYCFEADPEGIRQWKFNCGSDRYSANAYLIESAVGNHNGEVEFNLANHKKESRERWCSGSIKQPKNHLTHFDYIEFPKTITVPCLKLDTWYDKTCTLGETIQFAWMDVNGAEEEVITGGHYMFTNAVKLLHTEFSEHELYDGQITKAQLLGLLPNYEVILEEYDDKKGYGNLLLLNRKIK